MTVRPFLIALALSLLPPAAGAGGLQGRIWDVKAGGFISRDEAAHRMIAADILLLGEKHDNPEHHRLQAWAVAQLTAAGKRPLVAFEMIPPEKQAAIESLPADADADGLAAALDWSRSGWPDFRYYRPVFQAALAAHLPIRAANVDRRELRGLAMGEEMPAERLAFFGLDHALPPPLEESLSREIREVHCGLLPESALPGMVKAQRARDAVMAHALIDGNDGAAVLIAGAGHVRVDRGVPYLLRSMAPGKRVLSLAFLETDPAKGDPAAYDAPYDLLWFTSAVPPIDGCAAMRRRKG